MGAGVMPRFWAAPPGLYGAPRDVDPAASFINQALSGLGTARTFALQNRAQQDADQDRKTQIGLALLHAGFAPGVGSIPDFANAPETYQVPGVGPVHRLAQPLSPDQRATFGAQLLGAGFAPGAATDQSGETYTLPEIGAVHRIQTDRDILADNKPPEKIDPLSPEGIAATLRLKRSEATIPGGGAGGLQGREAAGVLQTLGNANTSLEGMEKTNAPEIPLTAALAGGVTGKLAGAETGEGIRTSMLSPAQQNYQSAATLWLHNYVALLPKARVQPTTLSQLRLAFFPPAGADPGTYGAYAQRRRDATAALTAAIQGQTADLSRVPGFEGMRYDPAAGFSEGAGGGSPAPTPAPAPSPTPGPAPVTPTPTKKPINWRKWK